MCTALSAAEHAVSTAMADAPNPKVYASLPAATLSAEPVAAYGSDDTDEDEDDEPLPPNALYSMCCMPTATATFSPRNNDIRAAAAPDDDDAALAVVAAPKVDSSKSLCCGSICRASPF